MNSISSMTFTTPTIVHWSNHGFLMERKVINVLWNLKNVDKISEKLPFLKTAFKIGACVAVGIGLIILYQKVSCYEADNLSKEFNDSPAISPKKNISPIKLVHTAREIKKSMEEMPLMGFGTFIGIEYQKIVDLEERRQIVEQSIFNALQAGCRHLDCASNYQNLQWVGNTLEKAFLSKEEGGLNLKREEIWITSKDGHPSDKNLDKTLEALKLDYLDLYLIHYPHQNIEMIWKEMHALVEQGLVRNIGVSNFYHSHMQKLIQICIKEGLRFPYANEMEISPWVQENQFYEYCKELGIRLIAYSPLGYGNCTALLETEQVIAKAQDLHATAAQVTLAWNMARGVAVIPSSRNKEHIESNCTAVEFIDEVANDQEFMKAIQQADMDMCSTITANRYKQESLELAVHAQINE